MNKLSHAADIKEEKHIIKMNWNHIYLYQIIQPKVVALRPYNDQNFHNLFITLMVSSVILKKRIIRCASSQPLPYVAEDSRPPQAPTPLLLLPQAGFEPIPTYNSPSIQHTVTSTLVSHIEQKTLTKKYYNVYKLSHYNLLY